MRLCDTIYSHSTLGNDGTNASVVHEICQGLGSSRIRTKRTTSDIVHEFAWTVPADMFLN